jgi:hypothetical protein
LAERLSGISLKVVAEPPGVMRAIWQDGDEIHEYGYSKPLSHRLAGVGASPGFGTSSGGGTPSSRSLRLQSPVCGTGAGAPRLQQDKPMRRDSEIRLVGDTRESWAELPEGLGSALALTRRPSGGFDAYASVAPIPALLLGKLGEAAGCHRCNTQGQWTLMAPHFIALHASRGGEHVLRCRQPILGIEPILLPAEWRVVGNELHLTLAEHETALFHVQWI